MSIKLYNYYYYSAHLKGNKNYFLRNMFVNVIQFVREFNSIGMSSTSCSSPCSDCSSPLKHICMNDMNGCLSASWLSFGQTMLFVLHSPT